MEEFKKFIAKGNVLDMAIGLIMATYFGGIVKSLVDHIIMPPVGMLLGGVDFSELKIVLQKEVAETAVDAADGMAEVAINYGMFINTVITFFIVSYVMFSIVKFYNKMKDNFDKKEAKEEAAAPEVPSKEEVLLTEIRDLLKNK